MTLKQYSWSLPGFILIAVVYARVTQPYLGPSSVSSAAARSLVFVFWLLLFLELRKTRLEHWSWTNFLVGSISGGCWVMAVCLVLSFTPHKSILITLSMVCVYSALSGLFASVSTTKLRAAITGLFVFAGQFVIDFCVAAWGWSKFYVGM